ncbi:hypothetical protein IAR55_003762 [Kwoniella newhampshirensis]|uniref:Glutathione S-transferase n=1 Tax=Kwoniella newhampshirensis TaxID=1651941 RepID=A0AAW0YYD3_9TREE
MSSTLPAPILPESFASVEGVKPLLHLYTAGTPNGRKPSILLEELHAAYPESKELVYDVYSLKFSDNDQKKPEFLKINPNGRIPALVDDNVAGGHNVWESASILLWLTEKYDKENKFWFDKAEDKSDALSWIFFAHGGVGPMQGQANHFFRYAPEKIPYGIKRYQDETSRLYSVLEDRLSDPKSGGWLAGGKYSVADINVFPWVNGHTWAGVETTPFPALEKWLEAINARPAVKKGLNVPPSPAPPKNKEEEEKRAEEARAWIMKGVEEKK